MKWSIIRAVGKIKYFNISYVVLLAVPILVDLYDNVAAVSELFKESVDFPLTLRWLYAASLFYAIGIAIYQYFCPPIIKRFGSPDEYLANSHEIFLRAHPHHRLNVVLAHLDPDIDSEIHRRIETLLAEGIALLDKIASMHKRT